MTPSRCRRLHVLLACMCAALCQSAAAAAEITLATLLEEMVEREQVARLPEPWYDCAQFSSYDRASVSPDEIATWYANSDHSQFIRTEENAGRSEHVMFDAAGPGAIVRFWSTWSVGEGSEYPQGVLRFYFDGADEPAIEGTIAQVLDQGLLAGAPLCRGVSPHTPYKYRGHNLYFSIPYAEHCKITYENQREAPVGQRGGDILYYQINYRTYEASASVRTFALEQLVQHAELIARTQQQLTEGVIVDDLSVKGMASLDGTLPPGESKHLAFSGPGAIRVIHLKLEASDIRQALRSTILEISFDGERCVWAPVGDFFGTGYDIIAHQTWYTMVLEDGEMYCWWVMPFSDNCKLTLRNVGKEPVEIERFRPIVAADWQWDERSLHFHSAWHELQSVETCTNEGATHGAFDVNYVTIDGAGVYVGDSLTIFNGSTAWWGEGDEKIYVDNQSFPSHFGTGTEDYYGYAWCNANYFTAPFHAQPSGKGNNNRDMSVNSRYRALDAIPFHERLRVDMELWHWRQCKMNYAPTTYFYARPGAATNVKPDPQAAAAPVVIEAAQIMPIHKVKGAIEGERLRIAARTGGSTQIQGAGPDWKWSDEQQLWWLDARPGDRLDLSVPVEEAGRYRVYANLTKAIDYAVVHLTLNEQPAQQLLDRFNDGVANDEIDLGVFNLQAGENLLRVEIVGMNPAERAVHRHMFGLDYLRLEPVEK